MLNKKQPYHKWECYKCGLFDYEHNIDYDNKISLAKDCFSDKHLFMSSCLYVINNWPNSCDTFLLNKRINRRAWLGRAAVFYQCQCPERYSREAWNATPTIDKYNANIIADKVISIYENRNKQKNKSIHFQMEIKWV